MRKAKFTTFIMCFGLLALIQNESNSQSRLDTTWLFNVNFGVQKSDKRLFDFAPRETLLKNQPKVFGTYQLGMSLSKSIQINNRYKVFPGLGLSYERSTFNRPFDHNYGKNGGFRTLNYLHSYHQFLLQFPIKLNYKLPRRWSLNIEMLQQLDFFTIAEHEIHRSFIWSRFNYYSIELNSGLEYEIKPFALSISYRFFQLKKIDKIIFNYIIDDPRTYQSLEIFNPFKLWLSLGFKI